MKKINKGWGCEKIIVSNEKYAGKLLFFNEGGKSSMHFHKDKDETWYVLKGKFELTYIKTKNAHRETIILKEGDVWRNKPLFPHSLYCIEDGCIIEFSTEDKKDDNYRIEVGDSQKKL